MGIATEFDRVVYVCDAQVKSIKLMSRMNHFAKILRVVGTIYEAFCFHNKGASYKTKTTEEAIGLVCLCKTTLEEHEYQIRAESNMTGVLNGPKGHVSAKTVGSVQFMKWGLLRLAHILGEYNFQSLNLLSCMTLDVENCHPTIHAKKVNMYRLTYARSFGATMKESVKHATHWVAYYHTSRRSWYPKRNTMVSLQSVPSMTPLPDDCDVLCNGPQRMVQQYSKAQCARRQQWHGTLPEFVYQ